jgi:hypothetical protein
MTYKWQERPRPFRMGVRAVGPRSIVTEVQTLDEALDELARRARHKKASETRQRNKHPRTLKQVFSIANFDANRRAKNIGRKKEKPPDPFAWTTIEERDTMIRHLYATGYWNARDLARKFRISQADVLVLVLPK